MARPARFVPRDASRRRVWVYLAVAIFILADILLIAWAMSSQRADADASAARIPVAGAAAHTATPAPEPVETTPPAPQPSASQAPIAPPTRILAALDATTAWRAVTGECPATAATPELTTDSGVTWKKTDATTPTQVTALQRIAVSSASTATMIGQSKVGCEPELVKTFVGGTNFKSYPTEVEKAWYIDPDNRAVVHGPSGEAAAPCAAVITLAPQDKDAAGALCADGQAYVTTDGAETWSQPVALDGAVAFTASEDGYLVASASQPDCAGVQLTALSTHLEPSDAGCYPVETASVEVSGNVAVASAAGATWLWIDDDVVRSSDDGTTWK